MGNLGYIKTTKSESTVTLCGDALRIVVSSESKTNGQKDKTKSCSKRSEFGNVTVQAKGRLGALQQAEQAEQAAGSKLMVSMETRRRAQGRLPPSLSLLLPPEQLFSTAEAGNTYKYNYYIFAIISKSLVDFMELRIRTYCCILYFIAENIQNGNLSCFRNQIIIKCIVGVKRACSDRSDHAAEP